MPSDLSQLLLPLPRRLQRLLLLPLRQQLSCAPAGSQAGSASSARWTFRPAQVAKGG